MLIPWEVRLWVFDGSGGDLPRGRWDWMTRRPVLGPLCKARREKGWGEGSGWWDRGGFLVESQIFMVCQDLSMGRQEALLSMDLTAHLGSQA